jgi:hypothetical protein
MNKEILKRLDERVDPDRERGGYKAMASSIGMADEWKKVRSYMQSKSFKEKIADAKKRAKEAKDPDAYLASVERQILRGHFGKSEDIMDLEKTLEQLNKELGIVAEQDDERRVPSKHPGKKLSAKKRSAIVKKAKAGKDIGKKGKKFKDVEAEAAKRYGSKESGKRVAAAAMWKQAAKG